MPLHVIIMRFAFLLIGSLADRVLRGVSLDSLQCRRALRGARPKRFNLRHSVTYGSVASIMRARALSFPFLNSREASPGRECHA
jgi:hypothetical protein